MNAKSEHVAEFTLTADVVSKLVNDDFMVMVRDQAGTGMELSDELLSKLKGKKLGFIMTYTTIDDDGLLVVKDEAPKGTVIKVVVENRKLTAFAKQIGKTFLI